jgi:hypothetical protein
MGADLYIERVHTPLIEQYESLFEAAVRKRDALPPKSKAAKAAQKEVTKYYDLMFAEWYFRDSYNVTNVLNRLGLSWWSDVIPLCGDTRKLHGQKLRQFREMVAKATLQLPTREQIIEQAGTVEEQGENSLAEWHKYFVEKQAALIAFLDKAIALDSAVRCSL